MIRLVARFNESACPGAVRLVTILCREAGIAQSPAASERC